MAEEQNTKKKKSLLNAEFSFGGISDLKIALAIKHLSLMLKSGLALGEAVDVLARQSSDHRLREVFEDIHTNIQNGKNLSSSMAEKRKVFSDIIISIISVGEQGGTLEKNLVFLSEYLKKTHELAKKIKGALIYPAIVFGLTIAEMLGVIFFILPKLEELFLTFENIPPFTQGILDGSKFIRDNSTYLGAGLFVFLLIFFLFLRTKRGKYFKAWFSLKFPVIKKLTKNNLLATFSRTVNILLESGVPIVKALEITSQSIGNVIFEKHLKEIYEDVRKGENIADALSKHEEFFPSTYTKLIEVGESTGSLEENLFYLYEFHSEELDDISTNLTTLLEPILLVIIGGMIGFLAIIIVGPIYQFTGSING